MPSLIRLALPRLFQWSRTLMASPALVGVSACATSLRPIPAIPQRGYSVMPFSTANALG